MMEGTLKCTGAQRATYEGRASLTRVHSHTLTRTNSTAHFYMWGPGCDFGGSCSTRCPEQQICTGEAHLAGHS